MKTVYSDRHRLHDPKVEFSGGRFVPGFEDPISRFKLRSEDYLRIGELIAGLQRPTLFIMEGGYAIEAIGINAVNVLTGYEGGRK